MQPVAELHQPLAALTAIQPTVHHVAAQKVLLRVVHPVQGVFEPGQRKPAALARVCGRELLWRWLCDVDVGAEFGGRGFVARVGVCAAVDVQRPVRAAFDA